MDIGGKIRSGLDSAVAHPFVANRVRLSLLILAYTLGNSLVGCDCPRRMRTGRGGACRSR